jgi:hypothetical protein
MLSSAIFFQGGGEDEEESESSASLSAPLLLRTNDGTISESLDNNEIAVPAAAAATAGSTTTTGDNNNNMVGYHAVGAGGGRSGSSNTTSHYRLLRRCVTWKSAADALPTPFHVVVTNGKICALATVSGYLLFISLWFPFWLLSFLLTEYGVYAMAVCTIFLIGRSIIRLIAFPGASQKVTKEIEAEFAKYSVRMIVSASHPPLFIHWKPRLLRILLLLAIRERRQRHHHMAITFQDFGKEPKWFVIEYWVCIWKCYYISINNHQLIVTTIVIISKIMRSLTSLGITNYKVMLEPWGI